MRAMNQVICRLAQRRFKIATELNRLELMDELSQLIVENVDEYYYPAFRIDVGLHGDPKLDFGDGLFGSFVPTSKPSCAELDSYHRDLLQDESPAKNLAGLASVIYWGYAVFGNQHALNKILCILREYGSKSCVNFEAAKNQVNDVRFSDGYARNRVRWFLCGRSKGPVTRYDAKESINDARNAISQRCYGKALGHIGRMGQLGYTPFASKVVAFLAPNDAGVYDKQIKLGLTAHPLLQKSGLFDKCQKGVGSASSPSIQKRYNEWCNVLQKIADKTNSGRNCRTLRPLDVERAIYTAVKRHWESCEASKAGCVSDKT